MGKHNIKHGEYSCEYSTPDRDTGKPDWEPEQPVDRDTLTYVPGWAMLHHSGNESPVEFYHSGEHLFTLQPEYVKVDSPGVVFHTLSSEDFPELTERQRTLCTVHMKYNELAVYNMNGELVQTTLGS